MASVEKYLEARIASNREFETTWDEIRSLYEQKLWHQITNLLLENLKNPLFQSKHDLKEMYDCFVSTLSTRMKPLSLVEISVFISEYIVKSNPKEAVEFMKKIKEIIAEDNDSTILCDIVIGMIQLKALKDLPASREIVEDLSDKISQIDGVTTIHSRYYQLSAMYYQQLGKHADYYREGLKYLGCANLESLSLEERQNWAFSIGLAALLGEGIYNFGELLTHEIFETLRSSSNVWLVDLMQGLSHGELKKLDDLAPKWKAQHDLKQAEAQIMEKATVLCLIELVFRRPLNKRTLTFEEISKATRVPIDRVEYLLMRALALHLMEGRIDEINKTVSITWLQPRVLDYEQIESMYKQLGDWCGKVTDMRSLVEVDSRTILT
ncbi:26S proteasome non-ATPase regulatory subunit 13 [Cichlidogyrus casuarinus]|uniref:26S proteasome non-ATPase regulatory subunit 13 n=1 Tax=Cichlidogyrus casuarinus TaxID=1844966 RepID=A0ABD2QFU7_9PLAT